MMQKGGRRVKNLLTMGQNLALTYVDPYQHLFIFVCFVNMVTWFVIIKKGELVELLFLSFDDNKSKCKNLSK